MSGPVFPLGNLYISPVRQKPSLHRAMTFWLISSNTSRSTLAIWTSTPSPRTS